MKRVVRWLAVTVWLIPAVVLSAHLPVRVRSEIKVPDLDGYVTLKCDFHMHTVFSDGLVWPTVRVEEAWREGLDAIALTEHIEHLARSNDVRSATNRNRSVEIARPAGAELDIIVIPGSEITRKMPPGHINVIFVTNANALVTEDWREAVRAARQQGAVIFWNHPGWTNQLVDGVVRWWPEHTELLEAKLLDGIEVFNDRSYYPEAHRWALEKNLTMFGNSDVHEPIALDHRVYEGERRPMTLVFARERSAVAIREALLARRTVVWAQGRLIGEERFLGPLFEKAVLVRKPRFALRGKQRVWVQITNCSDIDFYLESAGEVSEVMTSKVLVLPAQKTALLEVRGRGEVAGEKRKVKVPFRVTNLLVRPDEPLLTSFTFEVEFLK